MNFSITALVTIRYQWVRVAGLERLLMPLADNRNASLTGTLVLPATRCDLSDSMFAEIAFSSPAIELEGTVFVPKTEVISIVKTANPNDLYKVGYRGRPKIESIDPEPVVDPPPPAEAPN